MKKTCFLALVVLMLFSCKKESKPVDYTVIHGTVQNLSNAGMKLANWRTPEEKIITVNANGQFRDTIRTMGGKYFLASGERRIQLYLEPGYDLRIRFDADDREQQPEFSGVGHFQNAYLSHRERIGQVFLPKFDELYRLQERTFKDTVVAFRDSLYAYLETVPELPEEFRELEKRDIHYNYLIFLDQYGMAHADVTKNKEFKPSEDFLNELNSIKEDQEADFFHSQFYRMLLLNDYQEKGRARAKADSIPFYKAYFSILSTIKTPSIKERLLFNHARTNITYTHNLEGFYNDYMANSKDSVNRAQITKTYHKLKQLAKGSPSPKFVDYENHAGGTVSLDDLQGKHVYIDVWATWCGPCIAEIPALKELEKEYQDKDIHFVSISIDALKLHEAWKKMVDDKELGGLQLFADNSWRSQFVQDYQIMGIPRFILIDSEGNILELNAPRPSSEKIHRLFKNLPL